MKHKQGYSPSKRHEKYERHKRQMDLRTARKAQKSADAFLFGDRLQDYACDREVSRKVFEAKTPKKPRWAVRALVLLRDQGVCKVCGEEYGGRGIVVKMKPSISGGAYVEGNCMSICTHCEKVWSRNKNFYLTAYPEIDKLTQVMWVLKRRAVGKKDVMPLGEVGMETYRKVMHRLETLKTKTEVMRENNVRDIVGEEVTEQEIMQLFKQFGAKKKEDIKVSENDEKES